MRVGLRDIFASIPQFIIAKPPYPRRLLFNAGRILLRVVFFILVGKISICTLGCRVNAYESLAIADAARARGLTVVEWGEPSDYAVVNSCALTVLAQAKTRQAIRIFARKNPNSPIAVTGCYAQTAPDDIAKLPNVKLIAGNAKKADVVSILLDSADSAGGNSEAKSEELRGARDGSLASADGFSDGVDAASERDFPPARDIEKTSAADENVFSFDSVSVYESGYIVPNKNRTKPCVSAPVREFAGDSANSMRQSPPRLSPPVRQFARLGDDSAFALSDTGFIDDRVNLKIQDGCDNCCSYCIIPRARGLPRSRALGDIVADAKKLVSRGAREIVLTGINITKFASPDGAGLVEVVDALDSIDGLLRLRLGSIEPQDMPVEALLERAADASHKLQPHFHVSAQSLCDRVLRAMRRKNTVAEFLAFVARAGEVCPDISIGADIICGHPFERDCDYLETKAAMLSGGLSYAHVFTFSPRPKTPAALMSADTPPPEVRRARSDDLRIAAAQMHEKFMRSQLGKIRPILLEKMYPDGKYLAHTDNYIKLSVSGLGTGLKNTPASARLDSLVSGDTVAASAV